MKIRHILPIVAILLLAGCPKPASATPPNSFAMSVASVASDTVRVTAAPCNITEPAVSCRVLLTGTAGTVPLVFGPAINVAAGGTISTSVGFVCALPGQSILVTVNASSVSLNRSGAMSTATVATGTATFLCPDGTPNPPGTFTVTVTVIP